MRGIQDYLGHKALYKAIDGVRGEWPTAFSGKHEE